MQHEKYTLLKQTDDTFIEYVSLAIDLSVGMSMLSSTFKIADSHRHECIEIRMRSHRHFYSMFALIIMSLFLAKL